MDHRDRAVIVGSLAAMWILGLFVLIRVIVPGLMNMQNDGAMLAAPLVLIAYAGAAYVTWRKLFSGEDE